MRLLIQPTTPEAVDLYTDHKYNRPGDAGFDLLIPRDTKVWYKATTRIDLEVIVTSVESYTDVDYKGEYHLEMQDKHYAVMPRSSLSKYPYRQSNSWGLIDMTYRGNLQVSIDYLDLTTEIQPELLEEQGGCFTKGRQYSVISAGTRLFQIAPIMFYNIEGYDIVDSHTTTERADKGFGSTGH